MVSRGFKAPQEWTLPEINRGVAKIQRRISELQGLLDNNVRYDDQRASNLELEIPATIEDVFGTSSRESNECSRIRLRSRILSEGTHESAGAASVRQQSEFVRRVNDTIVKLQGIIKRLDEKREDFRKRPKCNQIYQNLDYCLADGTFLVALSYDPDAPTLRQSNI